MLKALVCVCHPPLPLSTGFPFLSLSFLSIPPLSLSLDPSLHLPLQQAHQCITHPHLPFPFFPCVCCHLFFLTPNLLDTSFSPSFCFPPSLSASVFPCLSPSPSLSACPLSALYSSSLRFPPFFLSFPLQLSHCFPQCVCGGSEWSGLPAGINSTGPQPRAMCVCVCEDDWHSAQTHLLWWNSFSLQSGLLPRLTLTNSRTHTDMQTHSQISWVAHRCGPLLHTVTHTHTECRARS